ncbi:SIMPL domain-containing protein [Sphingomonas astaxanthinifaciens]|uniref:DUF541 domain-containing protein n=1 Tax=Sphingomonas astaxanthinifaciens DSM 22298 TaxID=1123267 RepID=A0ABQ5ZC62_9SPHN|nr:SIMPL domain-containing protein [Sphingomonas astaxanthinifaciens]GLR48369.1 hypothetical protein GCM10007925_20840 [Sphingomonas astaxanthinifaciens DSM 22298]
MRLLFALAILALPTVAAAQVAPQSTIAEMATTPLVKLSISETLRTPPDEASITVGTQARAPTATAAAQANKVKTEKLLATIRAAGLRERDIQTQGIQLSPEYNYINDPATGRGRQVFNGYVASNSILLKTRDIPKLTALLDTLTTAGADSVYGPNFSISDPLPLRAEARKRALERGQAEALEYARNQGFSRVTLLSVEEGVSYRGTDVIVTASRVSYAGGPPPPPPPAPERDGGIVAPGQLETGVSLQLIYRLER